MFGPCLDLPNPHIIRDSLYAIQGPQGWSCVVSCESCMHVYM